MRFTDNFSLFNWLKLPENEKQSHKLQDCSTCLTTHGSISSLHKSYSHASSLVQPCKDLVNNINEIIVSPSSSIGKKTVQNVIKVLEPIIETQFNINFKKTLADVMNMSPRESAVEKNNKIMTSIRETTQQIAESMTENDGDVQNLLASGKSFLQYERERLQTCYVTTDQAERQADDLQTKLASGKKPKTHIGKYTNYNFNRQEFLEEVKNCKSTIMNWTRMAIKYNVTLNGKLAGNGGQILKQFAQDNDIDVNQFNPHLRISGRDHLQRIRRSKKRVFRGKLAIPNKRTAKKLKSIIQHKLESKIYDIGLKIAPKEIRKNTIDSSDIILKEIQRLTKSGVLISKSDEHYKSLSKEAVNNRLKQISSTKSTETDNTTEINQLMTMERQIHLKLWHDHSDILNHTYISFMVSFLYDHANFLTNEEFKETYPKKKPVDVQAIVERPNLYIFGQSGSKDTEQVSYTPTRTEDLEELRNGRTPSDLEDRRAVFLKGESLVKIKQGNINPFQNLSKDELTEELECRGIDTFRLKTKASLQEEMSDLLHGISRPPALLLHYPEKSLTESNVSCYEVLPCEPLHDISNVVQNIIQELPHHVKLKSTKLDLEKFCNNTIGDKNQIKGSDARLYAIKLSKFIENLQLDGKISSDISQLINSLVEIINIAYSSVERRTPRQILRLYNQTFLFAVLSKSIIGIPVKMTQRKFYGSHFHSLVVHLPEIYRIINTKSILAEQEERTFGSLRRLAEGYNIWWHYNGTELVFHDSVDEPEFRMQGPDTANFRSTSLKKERAIIDDIWQTSVDKAASSELVLPLLHVKTREDGKLIYKRTNLKSVMKHATSPTNSISDQDETNDNLEETTEKETNQDDNSESTEDYISNIPNVQEPPEVPAIDQRENTWKTRKTRKSTNHTLKMIMFFSVSRWTVQPTCSKIDVHESLLSKPNKLPASCRKKTTLDMVVQLLGPSSDVDDCLKYRELKQKHPGHKSFISAFDQSFSKLQIEVSKRYFALKEETTKVDEKENRENLLADKEIAQKLLDHWGMYYF
ncbi:unnamed protein product [Mytilus edulis]|uniref:Uncharacterized protein n=1 Tax=Mytilus edulis TaxID=6550 RepID=A0A8S3TK77_MYTED|nr:unnamed protein product [Mytilus edulis]